MEPVGTTWRHRTYLFVYPRSFTNGTSRAFANCRAGERNLKNKYKNPLAIGKAINHIGQVEQTKNQNYAFENSMSCNVY